MAGTCRGRTTVKCRRSRVATSCTPRRSASATTVASVVREREVAVPHHQLAGAPVVRRVQVDRFEVPIGERPQEQRLDVRASLAAEQVADLGHNSSWHEQPPAGQVQPGE